MPVITLPDGSQRPFDNPVTVRDVAADIGPGLAKAALAEQRLITAGTLALDELVVELRARRSKKDFGALVASNCWALFGVSAGEQLPAERFAQLK